MFGLDDLDPRPLSEEGQWFPIRDLRTGQPVERNGRKLELCLYGPDSDQHRAYLAEHTRRINRLRMATPTGEIDPKESERILAEMLPTIVKGWRGFMEDDGVTPAPFTPANLDRLFRLRWVALQTDSNAGSRANFLQPSVPASPTFSASAFEPT